jgi:cytochrome bd-type quinol oxidase subunit 2
MTVAPVPHHAPRRWPGALRTRSGRWAVGLSALTFAMVVVAQVVAAVADQGAASSAYRVLLQCWTLAGLASVVLTVIAFVRGERSRWLLMPALVGGLLVLAVLADVVLHLIFGPS